MACWRRFRPPMAATFHDYVLTEKGRGLFIVIVALRQWGASELYEPGEPQYDVVERRTGKPIRPLVMQSHDGRTLRPEDVEIASVPNCQSKPAATKPKPAKKAKAKAVKKAKAAN